MKRCPKCQQSFSDEYAFCLSDGTSLVSDLDSSSEETLVRPSPYIQQPTQPGKQGFGSVFAYLAVGLLALLIGGAIVFWLRFDSNDSSKNQTLEKSNSSNTLTTTKESNENIVLTTQMQEQNKQTKKEAVNRNLNESEVQATPQTTPTATPPSLITVLQQNKYEFGWTGGKANSSDSSRVSYVPVTNVSVSGNVITMNYAWKNGILQGTVSGRNFTGTWRQSVGSDIESGKMNLRFDESFSEAEGSWTDFKSGEKGTAFLRRIY